MCEYCENPMKWRIEDDGNLLVPLAKARRSDSYSSRLGAVLGRPQPCCRGLRRTRRDHQVPPAGADVLHLRLPRGPLLRWPRRGWLGLQRRELIGTVLPVAGKRCMAERECRVLNRLARVNGVNPGSYNWGTSGIVFSVDRYPGEDDTAMDPRPALLLRTDHERVQGS
jgi:hypothetical protein